jgi:6-phosphofructokinase 1
MSAPDQRSTDQLDFVTMEGLLAYGASLAQRSSSGRFVLPPPPPPTPDRLQRAEEAMNRIRTFIHLAQAGLPSAEAYRTARQELIAEACSGDPLVFFAAWNLLLARGELAPLYRAPIGATQKPAHRRPVAIVQRAHLTPQLAEGRIVLDLGDDRFWLLPRDLADRTLFLTMRHGVSEV